MSCDLTPHPRPLARMMRPIVFSSSTRRVAIMVGENSHGSHGVWSLVRMDVARYGGWQALWYEQSLWAVLWFRLGCAILLIQPRLLRRLCLLPWYVVFKILESVLGISLPLGLQVGGGLRIWHFGGIFVNRSTVIGRNCTLRQGVTLGSRHDDGPAPVLGDDVDLGTYAQVLGAVRVGDRARIGSMSVVLVDVPAACTAVGVPARILAARSPAAVTDPALGMATPALNAHLPTAVPADNNGQANTPEHRPLWSVRPRSTST